MHRVNRICATVGCVDPQALGGVRLVRLTAVELGRSTVPLGGGVVGRRHVLHVLLLAALHLLLLKVLLLFDVLLLLDLMLLLLLLHVLMFHLLLLF